MAEQLRVGIVGCGNVALNFHVPAYQALPDDYVLAGLADPTADRLELGREIVDLDAAHVHLDAAELVARDDIDVIDVCTPQHLHRDVVLAVVHNYLFFPEIVALRALIDAGELGDVRTVTVDMLGVVDSPGAAGYRPEWRHDPATSGGGVLMDMLHGVYLAEHLLAAPVDAISATIDTAADGDAVEGLALCRLEAGRRVGLVNIGWGLGQGGVVVNGTMGRAVARYCNDGTMPWAPFEQLTVTTEAGTRTIDLAPGQELRPTGRFTSPG